LGIAGKNNRWIFEHNRLKSIIPCHEVYLIAVDILLIKDKGILFVIGEQTVKLRGTLVAVSADN